MIAEIQQSGKSKILNKKNERTKLIPWALRMLAFYSIAYFCWSIMPQGGVQDASRVFSKLILEGQWGFSSSVGECFEKDGRYFPAYSPLYSVTPVPFLLIFGENAKMQHYNFIVLILAAICLWFFMRSRVELQSLSDISVVLFLVATPMVHTFREGNVWHFMHGLSNFALIAGLLASRFRLWWLVGLSLGYAAMIRMALIPGVFIVGLIILFSCEENLSSGFTRSFQFSLGVLITIFFTLCLQYAMTGNLFKSPYEVAWEQWGQIRSHGTFSHNYFYGNLVTYFGQLPRILDEYPWTSFHGNGQSLWWICPWLFAAFAVRLRCMTSRICVALVLPTALFYLFYFYSGYHQFGTRYWTDFMVLWVILAMMGWNRLCSGIILKGSLVLWRCAFVFTVFWSLTIVHLITSLWGKIDF